MKKKFTYKDTLTYALLSLNIEKIKRELYYTGRGISVIITLGFFPLPRFSKDKLEEEEDVN